MWYKKWLFVPAVERFLAHSDGLPADALIYDLEDSIRPDDKEKARERLCEKLSSKSQKEVYIRINSGKDGIQDLDGLHGKQFDGIVIPKMESSALLSAYAPYIVGKKVIALIESVAGVKNIEQIASSTAVYGIAFGGEDFCKELGVETNEDAMRYSRGQIVLNARYYHKYCLDTISLEYKDKDHFLKLFHESIAMGFHSKLLIHPAQAEAVLSLEKEQDIDEMRAIVKQYESSPDGIVFISGRWYEKPHIERLKQRITQAEAQNDEGCQQCPSTDREKRPNTRS